MVIYKYKEEDTRDGARHTSAVATFMFSSCFMTQNVRNKFCGDFKFSVCFSLGPASGQDRVFMSHWFFVSGFIYLFVCVFVCKV